MKRWLLASALVLVATVASIATIATSPDWLPYFCTGDGDDIDCTGVSPLLVGFVGVVVSLALLLVGYMRSEP
jgi:hypothetical protein